MSLDSDVRLLTAIRPFSALPREAIQLLAFSCKTTIVKRKERLFAAGDPADAAFLVLEGEIVLRRGGSERRAKIGALIGEAALFTETLRPADAAADAPAVLLRIPRDTFLRALSEFPQSAAQIRRDVAARAQAAIVRLEAIRRRSFSLEPGSLDE